MSNLSFGGDQYASLSAYELRIQKLWNELTIYDAVTKEYVDLKLSKAISDLIGEGTPEALNTLKEISEVIKSDENKTVMQILAMIASEADRIGVVETKIGGTTPYQIGDSSYGTVQAAFDGEASKREALTIRVDTMEGVDASNRLELLEQTVLTGTENGESDLVTRVVEVESALYGDSAEFNPTPGLISQVATVEEKLVGDWKLKADGDTYTTVADALLAAGNADASLKSEFDDFKETLSTNEVSEGTELYFTEQRAKAALAAKLGWNEEEKFVLNNSTSEPYSDVSTFVNGAVEAEKSRAQNVEATKAGLASINAFSDHNSFQKNVMVGENLSCDGNVILKVDEASGKYLYFSESWRLSGRSDRVVFERYSNGAWRTAIPMIISS